MSAHATSVRCSLISDDEILRIKQRYDNVRIINEHADLDEK